MEKERSPIIKELRKTPPPKFLQRLAKKAKKEIKKALRNQLTPVRNHREP